MDEPTASDLINGHFLEIHAQRNPAVRGVDLWVMTGKDGAKQIYQNVTMTKVNITDRAFNSLPTISLSNEAAQSLMDALWEAGVKPSGGEGHTAHIRALNAHLEDMRRLVFIEKNIEPTGHGKAG